MTRRRLDVELVRRGLAPSRTAAQAAIESGQVQVGGIVATKSARLVSESDAVSAEPPHNAWASRGAHKLAAALDAFGVEVEGRSALDAGASHGGFTDVLLRRGASRVTAVDVGYGQLVWRLRNDERVEVRERLNIRHADPAELGAPFDVVVADLSFISLCTVADVLASCGHAGTDWILLVKPQFEVGRDQVPRGGVVLDPDLRAQAVDRVAECFGAHGLDQRGLIDSPITGAKGNQEMLLWLTR